MWTTITDYRSKFRNTHNQHILIKGETNELQTSEQNHATEKQPTSRVALTWLSDSHRAERSFSLVKEKGRFFNL